MRSKKHKPEENIGKLREVEIVLAQGIWWPEDRSGTADEGSGKGESAAAPRDLGPDAGQADLQEAAKGNF